MYNSSLNLADQNWHNISWLSSYVRKSHLFTGLAVNLLKPPLEKGPVTAVACKRGIAEQHRDVKTFGKTCIWCN